jgi:hypothetical protein
MKRMMAVVLVTIIVAAGVVLGAVPVRAEADPGCPDGPTQGALALAIAQTIWGAQAPQTEDAAVKMLSDAGLKPGGGWNPLGCADAVTGELYALIKNAPDGLQLPAGTSPEVVTTAFNAIQGAYDILHPKSGTRGGNDPLTDRKSSASPSSPGQQ